MSRDGQHNATLRMLLAVANPTGRPIRSAQKPTHHHAGQDESHHRQQRIGFEPLSPRDAARASSRRMR